MKEKSTSQSFFSIVWGGLVKAFQGLLIITGLKENNKYTKVLKGIISTCITLWLLIVTLAFIYELFSDPIDAFIARNITEDTYYDSEQLSANIYVQESWRDNYLRVYNYETERTTLKKVDWVVTSDDNDSLAVYSKNGKRGYINRFTGEIALSAVYDKAWTFSEGLAAVVQDGELFFINHTGKVVLKNDWKPYQYKDFVFKNGYCVVWNGHEHGFGMIDTTGAWILEPSYDNITRSHDRWIVVLDGKYGLLDAQFNTILPATFEDIYIQDNLIYAQPYNASTRVYDIDGKLINDCIFDEIYTMYYEAGTTSNDDYDDMPINKLAVCYKYSVDFGNYEYQYGLLGQDGHPITAPIYTYIEAIGPDLFLCKPHGIIINSHGQQVN